jgi:preprotein translocase subunit YajC
LKQQDILLLLFVAAFALLMWNNGRKRKKAAQELQSNLQPGTEVMLSSGIFATIISTAEDRVTVSSGTSTLVVAKGAIMRVLPAAVVVEEPKTKKSAPKAAKTDK